MSYRTAKVSDDLDVPGSLDGTSERTLSHRQSPSIELTPVRRR